MDDAQRSDRSDPVAELVAEDQRTRGLPDTSTGRGLRRQRTAIIDIAARHNASNVRVFGSVARGTDALDSDIDLLVDLDEDVSLIQLIGLERDLAQLLGRSVDVVPARSLKKTIARSVLAEAIPL